jgi:hypothetical protein
MPTRLQHATAADLEGEPDGPTYRLSVGQYRSMKNTGIITREDRVELLEGIIFCKDAPPETDYYRLSVNQ